jgi:tetratricopeptide (TPR) repeat protein
VTRLRALAPSDDPRVPYLLGVALYHADEYLSAIQTLEPLPDRFAGGSTERREIEQVLGLSCYLAGRFPEAIPYLERTRAWAGGNLELHFTLGMAYIQTQRPDEARAALATTFGLDPESAGAHVVAAQMMARLEMEALAQRELAKAIEKDPRIPHAHYLLGQQAIFRGRFDEGIALTTRELEINPANAMAFYQLGDAYGRQSRWDLSIAALQQSLWLNPFYSGPYILLGRAYMRTGRLDTAESMLRRGILYDPNNRTAHYILGQLLQQMGRTDEARRELEIAEKLQDPR